MDVSTETVKQNIAPAKFTKYQKFVVGLLAFLQFSIILDFMIMSPLGYLLMPQLDITTEQFGLVVSVYAFSAGTSGLLASGFADKFDRKKFLLFFYTGFIVGTLLCGLATNYYFLLFARMITGIFGGVIGSVVLAITTDLFALNQRGRVMGVIQTAFAASQVLGIPAGLYLSEKWNWHAPFLMIVAFATLAGFFIILFMKPIDSHLKLGAAKQNPLKHLWRTVSTKYYLMAFGAMALLSTGGFMLMPFGSDYTVNNLKIASEHLPHLYLITGLATIVMGPLIGKAADSFGKYNVFIFGAVVSSIMVWIYTHLGPISLPLLALVNSILFVGIFSRIIPAQALMSAVPRPENRGAFMSVSASIQQISGGFASVIAGHVVTRNSDQTLGHFNVIGYIIIGAGIITIFMMGKLNKLVSTGQQF